MDEKRIEYLYTENKLSGLHRYEIVRETKAYYYTEHMKISKKKMTTGSGWNVTRYERQTPELDEKYRKQRCVSSASSMLHDLANGVDGNYLYNNYEAIKRLYDEWKKEVKE